ncbi:MAG TPA: hypothetical protein VGI68_01355 [Mycobacterium sp.]
MVAILPIPGLLKAATSFLKCIAGLGGASGRIMKGTRQIGYLDRAAGLQALVDRPGITAGFGD